VNYLASERSAQEVVQSIEEFGRQAIAIQADVSDLRQVTRMENVVLEHFGHVDILVNNAGINIDRTVLKMDHATWRRVMAVNLDGAFNCSKAFVKCMSNRGFGRIVNISSIVGQLGNFGQANYAASKAALTAMTKSLAKELAGQGITVNAVTPGFIETAMVETIPERIKQRLLALIPMTRFGRPEDVARAVVYLVSSDGDYITGQELCVNGGMTML